MRSRSVATFAVLAALTAAGIGQVKADPVADFYKGTTVSIIVGLTPGGIYSNMAQTIAKHLDRHIPGNPTVIAQNMPGASGTIAINHVYNVAPEDRAMAAPPGVPADRLAALEKAYMAMLADQKFLEDAARQQFPITPIAAPAIRAYVERLMKIKFETAEKLKKVTGRS